MIIKSKISNQLKFKNKINEHRTEVLHNIKHITQTIRIMYYIMY